MEWYYDVKLTQGDWSCACEKFGLDENTRVLRFENVNPGQNLWTSPLRDTIVVSITDGRFVIHGVRQGTQSNPPDPNKWHGTLERVERYGEAAKKVER